MARQIQVTNVFGRNLDAYEAGKRVIINQGGSRSSKSFSLIQLLIWIATNTKVSISIVSVAFPHLRRGVMRDFMIIMEDWNLYNPDEHTKTEHLYRFKNGSYIEFFSVDNALKVRGPGRDILFINEANLIQFETFTQLALRTKSTIFIDFNPAEEFNYIYEHIQPRPDAAFIKSTYLDNPFLPHEQVKEIENLKNVDSNFWRIYGEGERGHSEGVIYTHWQPYSELRSSSCVFGLDFGYNNPTALVRVSENDQDIYWREEIYQSHLTNSDLIPMLKQIVKSHEPVYCDTAEPNRIEELRRAGIKALPANKDVKLGIDFVKSRKLFIHSGSVNLLKEIKSYKYMDQGKRKGNEPEIPLKLNDHCFVGSTIIHTAHGGKEIKDVEEFDLVYTSKGLRQVLKVWDNGYKQTQKYLLHFDTFSLSLECTPDHRVYSNKGWKKISKLRSGMMVKLISSLTAEGLPFNLENVTLEVINTPCTPSSGNFTMANAQRAIMSITKTKTPGITDPLTLSLKQDSITYPNILKPGTQITLSGQRNFTQRALKQLKNGIKALKATLGIQNTPEGTVSVIRTMDSEYAQCVPKSLKEGISPTFFVTKTARLRRFEKGEKKMQRVYDLTVDGQHEYFANTILVHNCMDAGRYASLHFKKAKTGLNMSFHR